MIFSIFVIIAIFTVILLFLAMVSLGLSVMFGTHWLESICDSIFKVVIWLGIFWWFIGMAVLCWVLYNLLISML